MPDETYTHGHHRSVLRAHQWRTVENSAAYLLAHLRPGLRVLDVGCGPGSITLGIAERVAPGEVIGVDGAPAAIAAAETGAAEVFGSSDRNVTFAVGDAYRLPYPDGSFDVVHAHQVLQHLAEPVAALAEWRRVCRPGGIVAVRDADYAAMCWWPPEPQLDRWLELYRRAARANHGEPDAGRRLLGWALAAGFAAGDVECTADTWCYATPEDRERWASTWAERTTSSSLAEQLEAAGLATAAERQAIADAWHEWAAADDGWFVVINGELVCTKR
jgi:ubiquinone/menaquinone biosynthesis C-methylase UbiE